MFIHEMILGASSIISTNTLGLVLVSARRGEFDDGIKGQTTEHCLLIKALGINNVIIVVNKMDTVEWDFEVFKKIRKTMKKICKRYKLNILNVIPISALDESNVSVNIDLDWYPGPTLLENIDEFLSTDNDIIEEDFECKNSDILKLNAMFVADIIITKGLNLMSYINGEILDCELINFKHRGSFLNITADEPKMIKIKISLSNAVNYKNGDRIILRDYNTTIAICTVI